MPPWWVVPLLFLAGAIGGVAQPPTWQAPLSETVVADGTIGPNEYPADPVIINFTDTANPFVIRPFQTLTRTTATWSDLSAAMWTAHSSTALLFGFRVLDSVLDDTDPFPYQNDGVEIYLNADKVDSKSLPPASLGVCSPANLLPLQMTSDKTASSSGFLVFQ